MRTATTRTISQQADACTQVRLGPNDYAGAAEARAVRPQHSQQLAQLHLHQHVNDKRNMLLQHDTRALGVAPRS